MRALFVCLLDVYKALPLDLLASLPARASWRIHCGLGGQKGQCKPARCWRKR